MALPVLAFPFITVLFWSLGGGQDSGDPPAEKEPPGLSSELPDAHISSQTLDKMSLYEKARQDSQRRQEQLRADPYARQSPTFPEDQKEPLADMLPQPGGLAVSPNPADPNEEKVREKLYELEALLNEPVQTPATPSLPDTGLRQDPGLSRDLDRLEEMMAMMSSSGEPDPEMAQINAMLEKILDIQYPQRARNKLQQLSEKNKGHVYGVSRQQPPLEADLLKRPQARIPMLTDSLAFLWASQQRNGFYTAEPHAVSAAGTGIAIPASIHGTQTVVSGTTIKMRLEAPVYINGRKIPEGADIYGVCQLEGERLKIDISSIQHQQQFFPVSLSVHGMDGIQGIRIPGAIGRDAAKEGADRSIQSLDVMSFDASPYAQAAGAGVEAVKGFFSKKARLVKVTVKDGFNILLVDQKAKQNY